MAAIPSGKWVLMDPKPTIQLEVSSTKVKNGVATTTKALQSVPVSKTIEFTSTGYYIEKRRANNAELSGQPERWKVSSPESGFLSLTADSGATRSLKVHQAAGQLVLEENGKSETYTKS